MIKTYKKDNINLSRHFNLIEFACKDGNDIILLDDNIIKFLEKVREDINRPIIINSGYRTKEYNKKINGAKQSYHCKGMAVDITAKGLTSIELGLYCAKYFDGIIIYKDFVHCDTRANRYIYSYL